MSFLQRKRWGDGSCILMRLVDSLAIEGYGQDMEAPIGSNEVSIERLKCSGLFEIGILGMCTSELKLEQSL